MADITYPAGDTAPSIFGTITNEDGTPFVLTDCTVRFQMTWVHDNRATVDAVAEIINEAAGTVRYDPQPGDFATVGEYRSRWKITNDDNSFEHTQPADSIEVVPL